MNLTLTSVYRRPDWQVLFSLLAEREPEVNVSHRKMPTWKEHVRFVESMPYEAWYFIEVNGDLVGVVYLSKLDEIGVQIFKAHWGHGYGRRAVKELMARHGPKRFLANINPSNNRSRRVFTELGFTKCQETYECVSGGA
jgi:RimJ/RimL family protein N-acetyltransferase